MAKKPKPQPTLASVTRERDELRIALQELNDRASRVAESVNCVVELVDELYGLDHQMDRARLAAVQVLNRE